MADMNRRWRLARHPAPGEIVSAAHFRLEEAPIPEIGDGQVLVRTLVLGTSPAQRSYISQDRSMHQKIALGDVMRGRGIAVVVASRHGAFSPGDIVSASTGWQDYAALTPAPLAKGVLDTMKLRAPLKPYSRHLGILGGAGFTAYFGLCDVGQLKAGETLVVSAAAGGVGAVAGQIGKALGARVIGIAGTAEKCRWVTERLGFDACIDYRVEDVAARLAALCPDGMNVYFDNVGGPILDACLDRLALHARIVVCGFIATDHAAAPQPGPANYTNLVRRRARMEGFFVFDYIERWQEAEDRLRAWYQAGRLDPAEDVDDGLERMPDTLGALFRGANRGIKLCRVAPDP
jgi:NADPH-dependent curcumin reductase CurA